MACQITTTQDPNTCNSKTADTSLTICNNIMLFHLYGSDRQTDRASDGQKPNAGF